MLFSKNFKLVKVTLFYYWIKTQMSFCLSIWAQLLSPTMETFHFPLK